MVRTKPAAASSLSSTGLRRLPTSKPTFSVKDIRAIIPAHCFKHSLVRSISYIVIDAFIALALYTLSTYIDSSFTFLPALPRLLVHTILWAAYWVCQGCVCTGLWVIGHECGHGGFYSNELVCDIFGWFIHSFLLVPYFSWKISHRRHHSNTNNLQRDEVFVPTFLGAAEHDDSFIGTVKEQGEQSVLAVATRWMRIAIMLLLGWPLYLFGNATGREYKGKALFGLPPNHFLPSSPIFQPKEGLSILLSDLGLAIMVYLLYSFAQATSFVWLLKTYVVPYLIVNMWLVLITFLQHTHEAVPHYTEPRWEWLQGALCTVDRDYGILNHVFHHIGDTHVAHHLFHTMPHYHAEEATRAIKALLGDYYMTDSTPIATALFNTFRSNFEAVKEAKDDKGAFWF